MYSDKTFTSLLHKSPTKKHTEMMNKNNNKHGVVNASWGKFNFSNLAPRAENEGSLGESANDSPSMLSSMANRMSFEKLSQVFGATGLRGGNASNSTNNLTSGSANSGWGLPKSNSRNQEWATFLKKPQPLGKECEDVEQTRCDEPNYCNTYESMYSNDAEMRALLQSLKSKKGPVTERRHNRYVNEYLQPHDNIENKKYSKVSASVGSVMNELAVQRRPSHSTLRPSKSILLQSRYSASSLSSLSKNKSSEEPMRRKSSSSVKFSSATIHLFAGEYDKDMWYTKNDQQLMMVDMLTAKRQSEEKKKAKQSKFSVSQTTISPDPSQTEAESLVDDDLQNNKSCDSKEAIPSNLQDSPPSVEAPEQNAINSLNDCKMEADSSQTCEEILTRKISETSHNRVGELIVDWGSK